MKLSNVIPQLSRDVEPEQEYTPMYAMLHDGEQPSENELETLKAVETHGQNLNTNSLASLLEKGLIYTEWSDYGYKISEAGTQLLDGEEA